MNIFRFTNKYASKRVAFTALLSAFTFLPLASQSWAQSNSTDAIEAPVKELTQSIEDSLKPHQSYEQRTKLVSDAVSRSYDDEAIMRGSLGAGKFNRLSQGDKQKLVDAFRDYSVGRYVNSFKPGDQLKFKISPEVTNVKDIPNGKEVKTYVVPLDGSDPTEVDYLMHPKDGTWKICDILLTDSHISTIVQQRNDFVPYFKKNGVTGLVNILEKKAQDSKLN